MNRQQRRAVAKKRAAEKRIEEKIIRRDEVEVELYFTAFGLALNELYGWKGNGIMKVWKKADEIVGRISEDGETGESFTSLKKQLREKADIECSFV